MIVAIVFGILIIFIALVGLYLYRSQILALRNELSRYKKYSADLKARLTKYELTYCLYCQHYDPIITAGVNGAEGEGLCYHNCIHMTGAITKDPQHVFAHEVCENFERKEVKYHV